MCFVGLTWLDDAALVPMGDSLVVVTRERFLRGVFANGLDFTFAFRDKCCRSPFTGVELLIATNCRGLNSSDTLGEWSFTFFAPRLTPTDLTAVASAVDRAAGLISAMILIRCFKSEVNLNDRRVSVISNQLGRRLLHGSYTFPSVSQQN